jgi:hypothetical protein
MKQDHDVDPLLLSLARLPSYAPSAHRDVRTTQRCHAVLERQNAARLRTRSRRPLTARIADLALAAVLFGYASVALLQAMALLQAIGLIH